ncbi:MAG TPA: CvpA family protein [Chitinophagaceae bacterium]|nr:CvpA family protein [Chitinophagaceae bacterium]
MILDALFILNLFYAVWRGYRRGLIVGLFSLLAGIIGLSAAMKLSVVMAGFLHHQLHLDGEWLPVLSFILVFIVVVLLIRIGAKAIEKTIQFAMLGWLNKLGGILFFAIIYSIGFSIVLFYAEQSKLLPADTIATSKIYSFIQPWGPSVMDGMGVIIPIFKNMFGELKEFFGGLATRMSVILFFI